LRFGDFLAQVSGFFLKGHYQRQLWKSCHCFLPKVEVDSV
jgi:hypothetical protein